MKARLAKKLLSALIRGRIIDLPKSGILVLKTEEALTRERLMRLADYLRRRVGDAQLGVIGISGSDDIFVIRPGQDCNFFRKDERVRLITTGAYGTVMLDEEHSQSHPGPYSSSEVVLRRVNVRLDSGDIIQVTGEKVTVLEPLSPCPPHDWDQAGERCLKCGDKDWMTAGTTTEAPGVYEQSNG